MDYQHFYQQLPELFNNWKTRSCTPKSDSFKSIITQVDSMISANVMQLLNLAVSCLDEDEVYCDIGTFQGASLIAALLNNPDKTAYAVDNFSELDPEGENFDNLANNLEEFNLSEQVLFCCQDFEEFFRDLKSQELTEKIGVYFYDGSQDYRSCLLGLLALKPVISHQALIIVTNCQWKYCQQAVRDFLSTNSEAKLILDFSQADYLLWNGIQILSWDNQQPTNNNLENNITVDWQFQQAITKIAKAEIAQFVTAMQNQALSLSQSDKYSEAERIYLNLLHFNKKSAEIWYGLGTLYYKQEEYLKGLSCLNNALMIDDVTAIYHYTLGLILEKIEIDKAIQAYEKALQINPKLVDAYNNLGNIFLAQNQVDKAEAYFRKAITVVPLHFGSYINLGNLLLDKYQQIDAAIANYEKAFDLNPSDPDSLSNLSIAYKLKDNQPESLFCQAYSYFKQSKYEEALKLYEEAIAIDPQSKKLYLHLSWTLEFLGKREEALEKLKFALQLFPNDFVIQMVILQIIPVVYQDVEEIELSREVFRERLDLLVQSLSLDTETQCVNALYAIGRQTNFYLAYQCKNDLDLQREYGQIVHKIMTANYPQWSKNLPIPTLQPGERIRVGYISTHLHNHNGANWALGWIKNHHRQDFQIYCYHVGFKTDKLTEQFQLCSHSYVHIPNSLEAICNQIIADKLHILVFPAIGMSAVDGQLASLRLAPIQCTAWGHPVTSGLPTVDYYLSSELMEPENAQDHYSEQLVRLPNIGLCYSKPILPPFKSSRSEFGLPEDSILYLCCQSIFKYLPQYDYIFTVIARQLSNAKFVFISASVTEGEYVTNLFQKRLHKAFALAGLNSEDYCIILPRQNSADFLRLNLVCDIFLDTFAWNGGNTTLNAIACNLPVVTCPGEFMRGRHSYAFLEMLGVTDTIANSEAEYIEIAVKLGLDPVWRKNIAEQMSQNHDRLFDDKTCVDGLEAFYKQVVEEKSSSSS